VTKAAEILDGLTTVVNAAGGLRGGAVGDLHHYQYNIKLNTQAPFEII
jgi:hypothetical protein